MLKLSNLLKQGASFRHWRTLYFSSRTVAPVLNALLVGLLVGCTRSVRVIFPDETLEDAMRHLAALDVGRLPVVSRDDPHCLVGMLRRNDIIRAYATTAFDVQARRQRLEVQQWEMATGAHLHHLSVTENAAGVGRALRDLALPGTALISSHCT